MLYDVKSICAKVVITPEYKPFKKELVDFFSGDNMYNVLGLNEIYTHDRMPGTFIKETDFLQLLMLAKNKFNLDFSIENFTEGYAAIKKINEEDEKLTKHMVSSHNDVKNIVKDHGKESTYAKEVEKSKQNPGIAKAKRQQEHKDFILAAHKKKKDFWKNIDKQTDLNKDFSSLKVVSIDFEFSLNKTDNTCLVTECGISTSESGVITPQHYLIKDNHLQKSKYVIGRQQTFAFGETKIVEESLIPEILKLSLENADIVVFHEKREDDEILKNYGINLEDEDNMLVMDTQWCYKKHFMNPEEKMKGIAIEDLLEGLKIPAKDLHNAGNDAYYTLQLLLKMSQIYILRENLNNKEMSDKKDFKM